MKLLILLISVFLITACQTAPTPVPVKEISDAVDAISETVEATDNFMKEAENLAHSINLLEVPETIKTTVNRLVELAKHANETAQRSRDKIEIIQPITERIAGERDLAIIAEKKAHQEATDTRKTILLFILVIVLLLTVIGVSLVLRFKRLWMLFLYKRP